MSGLSRRDDPSPTREKRCEGMLSAVVYFPRLANPGLLGFRRDFDPFASLYEVHLPLVFPMPVAPGDVCEHVRRVLPQFEPFDIHITGVKKTWDHWLYFAIQEGSDALFALHERLYRDELAEYRRLDLPFEPHIGVGFFGNREYDPLDPTEVDLDLVTYQTAQARAEDLGIDEWRRVDVLTIVQMNEDLDVFETVHEIRLGA